MHGGRRLCSHRSTLHRKNREAKLLGEEIFYYLLTDMGHGAFVCFYLNDMEKEQRSAFCIFWLHFMLISLPIPLQECEGIGRTSQALVNAMLHARVCVCVCPSPSVSMCMHPFVQCACVVRNR